MPLLQLVQKMDSTSREVDTMLVVHDDMDGLPAVGRPPHIVFMRKNPDGLTDAQKDKFRSLANLLRLKV
jgi:hypothetical protein